MSDVRLYFFGTPRCERLGQIINFERRKSTALLAYLFISGKYHARDTLATLLWSDYNQQNSRTTLRQVLTDIKQKLGDDLLDIGREEIGISAEHFVWVDVIDFQNCLQLTRAHGHARGQLCTNCADLLTAAVDLYRADFLSGFSIPDSAEFDDWQAFQTEQLRLEYVDALDRLLSYHVQSDARDAGFAHARRWSEHNPLDERPHRYLMQLYANAGQEAAVTNQFNYCKQVVEAAGLTLDPETEQLYKDLRGTQHLVIESPVLTPTSSLYVGRLPSLPNRFVGRGEELKQICADLTSPGCRLLTLLGAPGVGKTRLGLKAVEQLASGFVNGGYFVPLASINDPALVAQTVARVLDVKERGEAGITEQLKNFLADKACLLLLDNFEHVLDAAAFVGEILTASPQTKILVTSREPLNLYGEHEYIVPPFTLPERHDQPEQIMHNEAVSLFAERAHAAASGFSLSTDNVLTVAEICRRLEGLPLAIELAATRVKLYSLNELLKLLEQRLGVLTSTIRNYPPRHQTLRAAIDWSHSLLSGAEVVLFRRIGVFVGGCTVDSVEAVCADGLSDVQGLIEALVNKSLLQPQKGDHAVPRFTMLETLGEYALAKLAESREETSTREALATYFVSLVEQAQLELRGMNQRFWVQRLDDDYDNIRAVLQWFLQNGDTKKLNSMGRLLVAFWHDRGYLSEGRYWLEVALQSGEDSTQLEAETLEAIFSLAWAQGDYRAAQQYASQYLKAAQILKDAASIAAAYHALGGAALALGEYDIARHHYEESRQISSTPKKLWSTSFALTGIGEVAYLQGDYVSARRYFQEDLEHARDTHSAQAISAALNGLAKVADMQGDYPSAQGYARESLALAEEVGNQQGKAIALNRLGRIARQLGNIMQAKSLHEQGLAYARAIHNAPITAFTLNKLGEVAADEGDYQTALNLHSDALRRNREMNDPYYIADNLCYLAAVSLKLGALDDTEAYIRESLELAAKINALVVLFQIFDCWAEWFSSQRQFERAAELVGFIVHHPAVSAAVAKQARALYQDLETKLPSDQLLALIARGKDTSIEMIIHQLRQR
ncbi:MAG: tetratricopeptide repeat protein [Chloroflexi bacterium]|nr:tetratricopeptide repeat protein [Chloroflexota bacterium]